MLKPVCVLACALAISPLAVAEIFKCVKDGETVYQNFPCHINSIGSQATAAPPKETGAAPAGKGASPTTQPAGLPSQAPGGIAGDVPVVRTPDGKYEPRVGMTRRQVRRLSWGEPEEITRTDEGEFVWKYSDNRVLRFDDKGRLTSVQR